MLIREVNSAKIGVDITVLSDGVKVLQSSAPLFTVFGREIYAQDLFQHGVVIRILQKRPLGSVRVRYLCPSGFAAVFKAPAAVLTDTVGETLYYATTRKYWHALGQYQASEAKTNISKLDLLNAVVEMNNRDLENVKITPKQATILQFRKVA